MNMNSGVAGFLDTRGVGAKAMAAVTEITKLNNIY